jgi:hypothetical protein
MVLAAQQGNAIQKLDGREESRDSSEDPKVLVLFVDRGPAVCRQVPTDVAHYYSATSTNAMSDELSPMDTT